MLILCKYRKYQHEKQALLYPDILNAAGGRVDVIAQGIADTDHEFQMPVGREQGQVVTGPCNRNCRNKQKRFSIHPDVANAAGGYGCGIDIQSNLGSIGEAVLVFRTRFCRS